MTELIHVEADNFRAFQKCALELGSSGLVLVAGPNNTGKSALLSMLDVVAGSPPHRSSHFFSGRTSLTAKWRLSLQERAELLAEAPDSERLIGGGVAQYLVWEFGVVQGSMQPIAVRINYRDDWRYLARLEVGEYNWKITVSSLEEILTGNDQAPKSSSSGGGSPIDDGLSLYGGVPVAQRVLQDWREGYFHFHPLRQGSDRSAALADISEALKPDGSNLATVLLFLHNNSPREWSQLQKLIAGIIPDIGELMTPIYGGTCQVAFSDPAVRGGFLHNVKDLGTGVEQLLMLLVVGLTRTARTVVLEDPEIGLHPSAQRALLSLMQDWARRTPILAATHSAAMLDWSSASTTVIAVRRSRGVSDATVVTTERAAVLRELGMRMSDVLSAERILILEGPTDKDILDVWFPDVLRSPRIVVLPGGGGYDARHADLLAKWLEAADQLDQRRILYVRDRDELSGAFLAKLEESPNIFLIPGREIENLLLDYEAIAEVINRERGNQGRDPVTGSEIAASARSAADELKETVVMKRTMTDFAEPIRLVDNALKRELARNSPSEEALTVAMTARLPQREEIQARTSTAWAGHSAAVDAAWEKEWASLAPGADVLKGVWQEFLGRGYSKGTDGPALAREMKAPPEMLGDVFQRFMNSSDG
ncbi:AAA family ATPase [Streptomyces sp. NPDC088253]|uniref:AAA family ATPase n=1 Tax=Streptomyces sp. NPDC088253 TaxID=3365846 RepID=UPI003826F128